MGTKKPTLTEEKPFTTDTSYDDLTIYLAEKSCGENQNQNAMSSYANIDRGTVNLNEALHLTGTLTTKPLVLTKELESLYDARYKTDYFPRGGKKVGKPQAPRYIRTIDNESKITIQLPQGYGIPADPENYFLEVSLVTVNRGAGHHWHVYQFQLHHTDQNVRDDNPVVMPITAENYQKGEIEIELVVIKTRKDHLRQVLSLNPFVQEPNLELTEGCKTIEDLESRYNLLCAQVAFSIVYQMSDGSFVRYPSTTVISNEIVEKKPNPTDEITCPHCSGTLSIKEQKKAQRKRPSAAPSASTKKGRGV
ncbi:unnamed protein product [Adineta ricciae]|uniref:Uncharacterized protein n=1 Tax=Adineta ricciae TaxID=249248 RepID=A0A815N7I4_ADIRI|nr:unnamed protein product [Adineta ricciae]CAF1633329.1 unnamed protein product [Adineta ricciae]